MNNLTYLDRFADWCLNNIKIFEHAQRRSDCISKIYDMSDTLNLHLIKLYLFQNSTYRDHWKDEIVNYLEKINKLVWSDDKKKFKSDNYFEWLFLDWIYPNNKIKINRIIKKISEQYKEETIISSCNTEELFNILESFYKNVVKFLEVKSFDYDKVEKLIDEKFDLI